VCSLLVMRQQLCQLWYPFVLADKELQVRVCVCVCVCALFSDAPAAVSAVVLVCAGRQGVAGVCECFCAYVCMRAFERVFMYVCFSHT